MRGVIAKRQDRQIGFVRAFEEFQHPEFTEQSLALGIIPGLGAHVRIELEKFGQCLCIHGNGQAVPDQAGSHGQIPSPTAAVLFVHEVSFGSKASPEEEMSNRLYSLQSVGLYSIHR